MTTHECHCCGQPVIQSCQPKPALTQENLSILLTKLTILLRETNKRLDSWPNDLNHAHVRHEAEGMKLAYLDAIGGIRRHLGDAPVGDTWPKE